MEELETVNDFLVSGDIGGGERMYAHICKTYGEYTVGNRNKKSGGVLYYRPHIVICRVLPGSPYRDLSCFARAYG